MREPKYRVWDALAKEMYYLHDGVDSFSSTDGGWRWTHYRPGKEVSVIFCNYMSGVLMDYTGLDDKNGKEIYEKDIAEFGYQDHPKRRKAYVEWNGQCYGLEAFVGDDTSYAPLFTQYTKALEVIGNIYESEDNDRGHPS